MKPTTAHVIYFWLAASVLLTLVLGGLAIADVHRIAAEEANEVYSDALMLQAANDLQHGVNAEYIAVRSYLVRDRAPVRDVLEDADREVERALEGLLALRQDPEERRLLDRIEPGLKRFRQLARAVSAPGSTGTSGALTAAVVELQPALEAMVDKQHRDLEQQHRDVAITSARVRGELMAIMGLAVLLLTALAVYVVRRLVRPLRALEEASLRIGAGEPGVRVDASSRDEFGRVALAFNDMAGHVEQARTRLERANEELLALDRYKDEFLGILSHELRTPLNFITGFTSVLADEVLGPLTPEQQRVVGRIDHGAARMLTLVDELLVFSAWRNGRLSLRRERAEIGPLVDQAIETIADDARAKDIALAVDARPDATESFDPVLLKQALAQLLSNAVKFTPAGGRVDVHAAVDADGLDVEVRDTGIGIAPADLPRLFGTFQQLDMSSTRAGGGVGLGLSLAKAIVEAHGGTIGVRSEPGHGSTFWFHLPHQQARQLVRG
jgi:signal transduction histidine kinase